MTITLRTSDLAAIAILALTLLAAWWVGEGGLPNILPIGGPYDVLISHESDDMDNLSQGQRDITSSLTVREKIEASGHSLVILDDDELPAEWSSVSGSPVVAYKPKAGGEITTEPLPNSPAELYQLLGVE